MGDDSSFRSRRDDLSGSGPAARTGDGTVNDAEDALAELARLMGEGDPFADFAAAPEPRSPAPPAPPPAAPSRLRMPPRAEAPAVERRFEDWQPGRRLQGTPQPAPVPSVEGLTPRPQAPTAIPEAAPRVPSDPYAQGEDARTAVRQGYGSLAARRGETASAPASAARQSSAVESDDERAYAAPAPSAARGSADGAYAYGARQDDAYDEYDDTYDPTYEDDGYMPPHGEEVYDEEPRRQRGRMVLIAAACVVGIGAVAAAGVFSYRMIGSGSSDSSVSASGAPVIKADTTPTKVAAPTPEGVPGGDGPKMIYDRVGSTQPGTERVVPREEQPVDVNTAAAAAPVRPSASQAGQAGLTEPKKVKTLAVRADGTIVASAAAPVAVPTGGLTPTAYAPTQNPSPVGLPTPTPVTTQPTNSAGIPVASTGPATAAAGAYVVQVSSQKSETDALGSWKVLQGRYPQLLGSYKATVKKADLGDKGIFYRAQVGPFANRDDAISLCNSLRAQGGECVVTRNN